MAWRGGAALLSSPLLSQSLPFQQQHEAAQHSSSSSSSIRLMLPLLLHRANLPAATRALRVQSATALFSRLTYFTFAPKFDSTWCTWLAGRGPGWRGGTGGRLKHAHSFMNNSLSAERRVMHSLPRKTAGMRYRNCKPALLQRCNTLMIVHVPPAAAHPAALHRERPRRSLFLHSASCAQVKCLTPPRHATRCAACSWRLGAARGEGKHACVGRAASAMRSGCKEVGAVAAAAAAAKCIAMTAALLQ